MKIKSWKNMATPSTDITAIIDDFEIIQMREAIFHTFIEKITDEMVKLFKDEIIGGIDLSQISKKVQDAAAALVVKNSLADLTAPPAAKDIPAFRTDDLENIIGDEVRVGHSNFTVGKVYSIKETCNHADWKTVLARPDIYPPLRKGEKVQFIKKITNLYGDFATVRLRLPNGKIYDIEPHCLQETL